MESATATAANTKPQQQPAAAAPVKAAANQPKKEAPKPKDQGRGIVKSVTSGDTIVVIHLEKNQQGPPVEREITLSNIAAPKLGRRKTQKNPAREDEPFAWQSRDFLRKKLIGKQVHYTIETKDPKSNKEYGVVYFAPPAEQENVAKVILQEGWAKLRQNVKRDRSDVEELVAAEEAAEKAGKGLWSDIDPESTKRPLTREVNPTQVFDALKGQPQPAVIEGVVTGSRLRVTLVNGLQYIDLLLSGVECPNVSQDGESEPFGREAKFFTEHFLLNRDVQIMLEGVDKFNFYGTVLYGGNNISEELLKNGLARYVDWSGQRTASAEKLKAAERSAKEKKLRLWANYVEPKPLSRQEEKKQLKPGREILGKVIKIINGGAIKVIDNNNNEYDIYFGSIKIPRQGNTVQRENESRAEAIDRTLAWEAKEYTRKRLIGQRVRCVLDYIRPAVQKKDGEPLPERAFFSVYLDKSNIAVELVEHGLATPQEHRSGEQRSRDYEFILFAEERAKKAGKGVHGNPEKASIVHVNDLSLKGSLAKAKAYFPSLKRQGRMRGVVEHVFSGSRVKLYIPKEGCMINFSLEVKAPRLSDAQSGKPEPFAEEALRYTTIRALHQDVEFDVATQDKGGNFIGSLWVARQNIGTGLLEEGLASISRGSLRGSEHAKEYEIAEELAKKSRRNIWKDYDPEVEAAARRKRMEELNADSAKRSAKTETHQVVVTEIEDSTRFWVQFVGPDAQQLETLMKNLSTQEGNDEPYTPKVNELVRAKFTGDDNWYRAKVLSAKGNEFEVLYVDYGNSEVIGTDRITKLNPELATLRPQAKLAHLAFLRTLSLDEDFGEEAAENLKDLVWGKTLTAHIEYREDNNNNEELYLSLYDEDNNCINAQMLEDGLARVERVRGKQFADQLEKLKDAELSARRAHVCLWQYGDPGSDDEDDAPKQRGKK